MSAPPANPKRRRQHHPCGKTCPNIAPAVTCEKPAGHGGVHAGGRVHWLKSVEDYEQTGGAA